MQSGIRYKVSVRPTRAYLAGFGTSGSMLAGAAVLFLLGSAIVAFSGWPQIGARAATSNVSAAPLAVSSRAARRLDAVLAAAHGPAVAITNRRAAARAGRHVPRATGHPGTGTTRGGPAPGQTASPGNGGSTPPNAAGGSSGAAAGQCGCTPRGPGSPVSTVTSAVSGVGSDVGKQITGLGGTGASAVGAVNPQAGSVVGSAGSTAGNTVTGAVNTVTNAVTNLGNALGGNR